MQTSDTPPLELPAPLATRREWLGLATIALTCMVYAMDLTVLNLALPALAAELKPSSSQMLWVMDIYGFMVAGFLITMGTLGDRIGRRKILLWGAAAFAGASVLAALASSSAELIAARALLGIAGATLAPSTLSLIRNMFHNERERQQAIGIWIASFSLGGAVGPLVGGVLIEFFHWSAVFWAAVPVMALLLLLGPRLLPEYKDPQAGQLDLVSAALSLAAILGAVYSLKVLLEHGATASAGLMLMGSAGLGALFWRRQQSIAYPLLDVGLFANPRFTAALAAYAISCLAMFGVYVFIAQYLQLVSGMRPLIAGLATLPWALSFIVGSLLAPKLVGRASLLQVLVGGLLIASSGFAILALALPTWGWVAITVGASIMGLGMAPVFTLGNEMIITAAPPERAGAASALSETASELSGALGIAVLGSLGMWLYRNQLAASWPAGLEASLAAASATLSGALALPEHLPQAQAAAATGSARAAFTYAMQWIAGIGMACTLLAAMLCVRKLR
jgi:MFS transporter, DHA2 family, multidrug resistance protein